MKKFETALIKVLNNIATTNKYFGEFVNIEDGNYLTNELPAIYVDFVGSSVEMLSTSVTYNIYIVHISYSKSPKTRQKKHEEIYELLQKISEALHYKSLADSNIIIIKLTKKIFDAKAKNGYLTVFNTEISTELENTIKGNINE
jgi:hypothetical protein